MSIPSVAELFDPLLRVLADGKDYKLAEVADRLAEKLGISESDRRVLLPSGKDQVFSNRIGWARTYLKKAGLLSYLTWGVFRITKQGQEAVKNRPIGGIDLQFLKTYPDFLAFYTPGVSSHHASQQQPVPVVREVAPIDPEESIEVNTARLGEQLKEELLARVKAISPQAFEKLVVRLIRDIGYGGTLKDAGEAIGRAGDGGIDGVVREDKLGLDLIYLQAKRWESSVGRPLVQGFVGALHGRNARRGVMITTSTFTSDARSYAEGCADRIILIDGEKLVDLMFEYNIGVSVKTTYEIKELNLTFFEQFA